MLMKKHNHLPTKQAGYLLFEVMISLLIFSVGVLGIVGTQVVALQQEGDAQSRADACFLANELISKIWVDHLLTPEDLQVKYSGGNGADGTGYTEWLNSMVKNGVSKLPGVTEDTNVPKVTVSPQGTGVSLVSIELYWQPPDATGERYRNKRHEYRVTTQISAQF